MSAPGGLALPQSMVDPASLVPHPHNARRHNTAMLRERLSSLGLYKAIVANRGSHTGRANEILAGHGTLAAFTAAFPGSPVQVSWVDVDDATALRILLGDNESSDSASNDSTLLLEALDALPSLELTGFTGDDLDRLRADLTPDPPPPPPPLGAPTFTPDNLHRSGTRIMVLEFPTPTFAWARTHLTLLAEEWGLVAHADVLTRLVADWSGSSPPVEA